MGLGLGLGIGVGVGVGVRVGVRVRVRVRGKVTFCSATMVSSSCSAAALPRLKCGAERAPKHTGRIWRCSCRVL